MAKTNSSPTSRHPSPPQLSEAIPFLRSSPPPSLPHLPPISTSPFYNSKKRPGHHLAQTDSSLASSDPAYFSSDDIANASSENYTAERKKRRYRGCWWEHRLHQQQKYKREWHSAAGSGGGDDPKESEEIVVAKQQQQQNTGRFTRNFDSGVWMASDDSNDFLGDGLEQNVQQTGEDHTANRVSKDLKVDVHAPHALKYEHQQGCSSVSMGAKSHRKTEEISRDDRIVRDIVASCLVSARSAVVDLSGLDLKHISSESLHDLHQLACTPLATSGIPVEEAYRPFSPLLGLFLGNNNLSSLPAELWTFSKLIGLSLRNNALKTLSPSIAQLRSLASLNISTNQLRYLPCEMLSLFPPFGELRDFKNRFNAYLIPHEGSKMLKQFEERRDGLISRMLESFPISAYHKEASKSYSFIASSPAAYFARNGQPLLSRGQEPYSLLAKSTYSSPLAPQNQIEYHLSHSSSSERKIHKFDQQERHFERCSKPSLVPSLFELSLRSIAANLDTLPPYLLPADSDKVSNDSNITMVSPIVMAGLNEVRQVWSDGGRFCSVCDRAYVNPRSEWLEIWSDMMRWPTGCSESPFVPFLRRCCGCVDLVDTYELGAKYSDHMWRKFGERGYLSSLYYYNSKIQ